MGSLATDTNDGEKEIHVLVTGFGVRSSVSAHYVLGLSGPPTWLISSTAIRGKQNQSFLPHCQQSSQHI